MARDRLFFIISFAVLGLTAAFLFRSPNPVPETTSTVQATEPQTSKEVSKEGSMEILTAKRPLRINEPISPEIVVWKKVNPADIKSSYITNNPQILKSLPNAVTLKEVPEGEPILYSDLAWTDPVNNSPENVILSVSPGMRAIPFALPPKSGLVQFLSPGMYVDVNFTSKSEIGFGTVSATLLSNVKILGISKDQAQIAANKLGAEKRSEYPTELLLEMSPRQAEIFFYAEKAGTVGLGLMEHHAQSEHNPLVDMLMSSESAGDFHSILVTYMVQNLFPQVDVQITATPKGYVVSGKVTDPQKAAKIIEILEKLAPGGDKSIVNLMEVEPQQVLLAVKICEVANNVLQDLGVNWEVILRHANGAVAAASVFPRPVLGDPTYLLAGENIRLGNDGQINFIIDMLERDGYAKVIAEPNLTTTSGNTAHFFSGGEFPILIPQGGSYLGTVTVEFKKYGVMLDFTPFVDLNGLITLHVHPEVSTIDRQNAVILQGFVIPAIIARSADSTVKLWSGQSYIIAGLIQNEQLQRDNKLFNLDKLPLFGPLFASKHFEEHRTQLVVIVTPFLIQNEENPVADDPCCEIDCKEMILPEPLY